MPTKKSSITDEFGREFGMNLRYMVQITRYEPILPTDPKLN